jgi:Leucine-rich repeat (LRR) protein
MDLSNKKMTDQELASLIKNGEIPKNVEELYLSNNQISDLKPLQSLTNLKKIYLRGNKIKDITPLQSLTNLTELDIKSNGINDLGPLCSLTNLTKLIISGINDITPLHLLLNLTSLSIDFHRIHDFAPLQMLTKLTYLFIGWNQDHRDYDFIADITPLQSLTNLTELRIIDNKIKDISSLQLLTNLTTLWLDGNNIDDITPLKSLTNLTELHLRGNKIINITPLQSLANLTKLDLSKNKVSDINQLRSLIQSLEKLTEFSIGENCISDHFKRLEDFKRLVEDIKGSFHPPLQHCDPFFTLFKEVPIENAEEISKTEEIFGSCFVSNPYIELDSARQLQPVILCQIDRGYLTGGSYARLTHDGQRILYVNRIGEEKVSSLMSSVYYNLYILDAHNMSCLKDFGQIEIEHYDWEQTGRGWYDEHPVCFRESIDGKILAFGGRSCLKLISLKTGNEECRFPFRGGMSVYVNGLFFLPDGRHLLVWVYVHRIDSWAKPDKPHRIEVIDINKRETVLSYIIHRNDIKAIVMDNSGEYLAIRTFDRIYVYKINTFARKLC